MLKQFVFNSLFRIFSIDKKLIYSYLTPSHSLMRFYNHYDLDAMADHHSNPIPDEVYQPLYPCEIESVSNDHFTVIALHVFESPSQFIEAFEALFGVRFVKHRKNRIDIYLHSPTQFPTDFIQEFHQTYDAVQQLVEVNSRYKQYPIPEQHPKPRQEILNHAKEILLGFNLSASEKVLRSYYRKIRNSYGPGMHPYFAGLLIVDMVKINRDVVPVTSGSSVSSYP